MLLGEHWLNAIGGLMLGSAVKVDDGRGVLMNENVRGLQEQVVTGSSSKIETTFTDEVSLKKLFG